MHINIKCIISIIVLNIILVNYEIYSDSIRLKDNYFSVCISSGISVQMENDINNKSIFNFLKSQVSIKRINIMISYNVDKSIISLNYGNDEFLLRRFNVIEPIYSYYKYEQVQWFGLSYGYLFMKKSNYALYSSFEISGNDEVQLTGIEIGIFKKIINNLSIRFALRYTVVFEDFNKHKGSQIGLDYGLAYNL